MPSDFCADADNPRPPHTTAELAALSQVGPKAISRWAHDGRIRALVTPGGRRRRDGGAVLEPLTYVPTQRSGD